MTSYRCVQDVEAFLSRPWKRHQVGRQRGGRRPVGGGPISRLSRFAYHGRTWLSSSRMKAVGGGMVAVGGWLGRAGGGGAPPDAA